MNDEEKPKTSDEGDVSGHSWRYRPRSEGDVEDSRKDQSGDSGWADTAGHALLDESGTQDSEAKDRPKAN